MAATVSQAWRYAVQFPRFDYRQWSKFSAATLPAGALGVWYMNQYQTTDTNPIVPNAASTVSVFSKQLIRQSRRIGKHQGDWNWTTAGAGTGVTLQVNVLNGVNNPVFFTDMQGKTEAARMTITAANGTGFLYQTVRTSHGTGAATVAVDARLVSGNGKFKIGDAFGTFSPELTATGTWQRFVFTNASLLSGYGFGIGHNAPAADTVIDFNNFNVYPGSSDLGVETLGGHLKLGISKNANSYTYVNGVIVSSQASGYVQFENTHQPTNTTIFFHGTVNTPFTDPNIQGILSQPSGDGYTAGLNTTSGGLGLSFGPDGSAGSYALLPLGGAAPRTTWDTVNSHVYAVRWNGTNCTWWVDGVQTDSGAPATMGNIPTINDMLFNCLTSHPANFAHKALVYYLRALTDGEMATASTFLASRA